MKMLRFGSVITIAASLFLTACWNSEAQDPLSPDGKLPSNQGNDALAAINEIASLMEEGESYAGIIADLEMELTTQEALRFKGLVERAARIQLEFEKEKAEIGVDYILSPELLSTFEGRQSSLDAINNLRKSYDSYIFVGSEITLDAVRFIINLGGVIEFDANTVLQEDIDALSISLNKMLQSYSEIVVACNQPDTTLQGGQLVFTNATDLAQYEAAVAVAQKEDAEFQATFSSALNSRQNLIDQAVNAARESLSK